MSLFWLGLLFAAYFLGWFAWVNQLQERLYGQAETIDRLNRRVEELEAFKKSLVMPSIQDMYTVTSNLPKDFDWEQYIDLSKPLTAANYDFSGCEFQNDTTPPSTDL